jgi:hypothetical protein
LGWQEQSLLHSGIGFLAALGIANLLWFAEGILTGNYYLSAMFALYWITAFIRLINSLTTAKKSNVTEESRYNA